MPNLARLWSECGKSITATAAALIVVVHTAVSDGHVTKLEWVQIAAALVTAVGVWWLPDHPTWGAVKVAVAFLTMLLGAIATVISQGLTSGSWPDILIGALTVMFVGLSPSRSVGASSPPSSESRLVS